MDVLSTCEFKYLDTGEITPEELFMNAYTEEVHKSEQVRTSNELLRKFTSMLVVSN